MKIHPLLDPHKQIRARQYEREKRLLGLAGSLITFPLLLVLHYSGFSHRLAHLNPGNSTFVTFLVYTLVMVTIITVAGLPLGFYTRYIHEQRWNFSNQTVRAWFWEALKSYLLGLVLASLLLGLLAGTMALIPSFWWLAAGLGTAVSGVILTTLAPLVILPLFNQYTPIDNPELVQRLHSFLVRAGLQPSGFFKVDLSRQTKKENAFLAGLGWSRRVVLSDTLMEHMSIPEIEAVVAHEVGHYRHRHIWKFITLGSGRQLVVFFLVDLVLRTRFPEFLTSTRWNLTLLPVMAVYMSILAGVLFGLPGQALARFFERQADRTALELIPDREAFLKALAGLANRNLADAYPPKWVKWMFYSHPPIGERLARAETFHLQGNSNYHNPKTITRETACQ